MDGCPAGYLFSAAWVFITTPTISETNNRPIRSAHSAPCYTIILACSDKVCQVQQKFPEIFQKGYGSLPLEMRQTDSQLLDNCKTNYQTKLFCSMYIQLCFFSQLSFNWSYFAAGGIDDSRIVTFVNSEDGLGRRGWADRSR